ncbi:hypothetical protein [Sphingomonas sp.]|uniref:hypothetical protein n=1 Tax=Sphingomonas sp. TaxID=28214 RepID=UPI003AFF99EB
MAVVAICFAVGCCNHVRDYLVAGPRPYRWAPWPLEAFWSALAPLDGAVVLLLATGRRRAGLGLALAVMVADVGANVTASIGLGIALVGGALLAQTGLLGFLAGSVPFLWREAWPGDATDVGLRARLRLRPDERDGRRPRVPRGGGGVRGWLPACGTFARRGGRPGCGGRTSDGGAQGTAPMWPAGLVEHAMRGKPPLPSAPTVRTVAGAVAPAPSHPVRSRPPRQQGERTVGYVTYTDRPVKGRTMAGDLCVGRAMER